MTELEKVRQEITNLCATIGDRSFVIRESKKQIEEAYDRIDKLRITLKELEDKNGPETAK